MVRLRLAQSLRPAPTRPEARPDGPAGGTRASATRVVSARWPAGYVTRMKDVVCQECSSSISFASASVVASCTLCGADLDLSSAEPVEVAVSAADEVRRD